MKDFAEKNEAYGTHRKEPTPVSPAKDSSLRNSRQEYENSQHTN